MYAVMYIGLIIALHESHHETFFSILARLARFVIFVIYFVIGCCLQIEGDHLSGKPENVREF